MLFVNGFYVISALTLLGALGASVLRREIGKLPTEVLLATSLGLGFFGAVKNAANDHFSMLDGVIVIVAIVAGLLLFRAVVRAFKSMDFPISSTS